jgi:hypothetical protein
VDLPVAVAILSEDILQEHQLGLQAVFTRATRRNNPEDTIFHVNIT